MTADVQAGLWQLYERWDGHGLPHRLAGEAMIPVASLVRLCQDAALFLRLGGAQGAREAIRNRSAGLYPPELVKRFDELAAGLLRVLDVGLPWAAMRKADPCPHRWLEGEALERVLDRLGHFADLKSPFTRTHASGVARLSERASRLLGLEATACQTVMLSGFVHDLGRVAVSASTWDRAEALTPAQWEQVRLHPYHSERILSPCAALKPLAALASQHHERLDGSGYHRNWPAGLLSPSAQVLQTVDAQHAMTEARAHRPARSTDEALEELRREATGGKLDADVVQAV